MTFKFLSKNRWLWSSLTSRLSNNENCMAAAIEVSATTLTLETKTDTGAFASSDPPKRVGSVSQLSLIRKPEWGFMSMHHCQNIATLRDAQYLQCKNESNTRSMQIVDALHFDEKARAFDLLLHLGHSLRTDDFVHILEHCARAPDPLFAWETWKIIDERKIRLNSRSCLLMLKALCQGGNLEKGFNFLRRLGEKGGIYPFISAYNYFLGACIKLENANLAGQCLDLMENRFIGRNEATYVELLNLAVWQKNLLAVQEFWKDYIKLYQINLSLLRKFVWSFKRLDDLKSAFETLQIMVSIISQSTSSIRTLEELVYPSSLDVPIPSTKDLSFKMRNLKDTDTLTLGSPGNCKRQFMISFPTDAELEGKLTDRWLSVKDLLLRSFNDVIHACARAQNYGLAQQLVQQMHNIGLEPSSRTFGKLVQASVRTEHFTDGMELLKMMQERKLKPFYSTIAALSIKCSRSLEPDLAEELLKEISGKRSIFQLVRPYNAFLKVCDLLNQPERGLWVLKSMKEVGLQPDIMTYESMLSLFGIVNAPYEKGDTLSHKNAERRISAILMDMTKNGVQQSMPSMHILLRAYRQEGMLEELLQYLAKLENRVVNQIDRRCQWTRIYNEVLISLVRSRQISMAFSKFRKMKLRDIPSNEATYITMIECCSTGGCVRSAYAFISLMVREGFYLTSAIYTSLIKGALEYEDFDEAFNILDQACTDAFEPDIWPFNAILYSASRNTNVRMDVIEHTIEKMHQEKVSPDATTCGHVFEAYIRSGLYRTAMEALEVLCVRMILSLEEEKVIEEYEKLIYHEAEGESDEAERAIVSSLARAKADGKDDNLVFALLNLRWCAILKGLPINWSSEQSWWSQRLSAKYDVGQGFNIS